MTITYEYEDALYVNLTNKCNCNCVVFHEPEKVAVRFHHAVQRFRCF